MDLLNKNTSYETSIKITKTHSQIFKDTATVFLLVVEMAAPLILF